jgi:hypothetical protein
MRLLFGLLLGLLCTGAGAEVRAWFDRDTVVLGETVTLNVEADGVAQLQPDLSSLAGKFKVVGSSSSSQLSLVNGQQSARTLWAVALEPLVEGVLGVPALSVGGEQTAPLTLTVLPAPRGRSGQAGDNAFIEVEADTLDPYVQQQVRYTVRLFYAVQLLEGQLDEPQPDGARMQRIGNDASYQRTIAGRRYQVVERRYTLAAERSGRLEVPPPRFRGRAAGGGLFGAGGGLIAAAGDALVLDVRPRPDGAAEPWLPARALRLHDDSAAAPVPLRVGEPLTLALRLSADGLLAEQLPELELPALDGAQVYPDRESSQTREAGDSFQGERVRRFAIVPSRPGTLTLPALRIAWWNTRTDRAEVAELPARSIEVLPAAGAVAPPAIELDAPVAGDANSDAEREIRWRAEARRWQWVAGGLLLLWLATLAWATTRSRVLAAAPAAATSRAAQPRRSSGAAVGTALRDGDPARIALALRHAVPAGPVAGLDEVAAALADPGQAAAVAALERLLYFGGDVEASVAGLRAAFTGGPQWHPPSTAASADELPPLYR